MTQSLNAHMNKIKIKKKQKNKNLQTLARKIPQNLEMPTCMDLKAL
jgi:hypothetical protein